MGGAKRGGGLKVGLFTREEDSVWGFLGAGGTGVKGWERLVRKDTEKFKRRRKGP